MSALVKIDVEEGQRLKPNQENKLGRNCCYDKQGRAEVGASSRASGSGKLWEPCLVGRWARRVWMRLGIYSHHHHLGK